MRTDNINRIIIEYVNGDCRFLGGDMTQAFVRHYLLWQNGDGTSPVVVLNDPNSVTTLSIHLNHVTEVKIIYNTEK